MKVSQLSLAELSTALGNEGVYLHTSPFVVHLRSNISSVARGLYCLYADYELSLSAKFSDFHIEIMQPNNLRRWYKPKISFVHDGEKPFTPLPLTQAFPLFEWGLNWCVANNVRQHLIFHAAMLEKDGNAVLLPGVPGAGKSTLCAALVCRGWRLLTDELAMISMQDNMAIPVPRPISLKNESIEVVKCFDTSSIIGELSHNTAKGTVALMKPPLDSIEKAFMPATPAWVVFPRFKSGSETRLEQMSKCDAFMHLIKYSFNYHTSGEKGFDVIGRLMDMCDSYSFSYSDLDEAISVFESLGKPGAGFVAERQRVTDEA